MRDDKKNNESDSARTSAASRPILPPKSPTEEAKAVAKTGVSESAYLTRQAQFAQQAMTRTLADAASLAKQGVDPREWMQQAPWITLGLSAVASFAATAVLVPSKEQQALKRLAAIERALKPKHHVADEVDRYDGDGAADGTHHNGKHRRSLKSVAFSQLMGLIKPSLISMISAGLTAAVAKPSSEEMQAAAAAGDAE